MNHDFSGIQIEELRNLCGQAFGWEVSIENTQLMAGRLHSLYEALKHISIDRSQEFPVPVDQFPE